MKQRIPHNQGGCDLYSGCGLLQLNRARKEDVVFQMNVLV
jgi:hypothetical protein